MELHRLFIGLPLPEEYQDALKILSAALRLSIRSKCVWTQPGNWHVTLKFLGDTPPSATPAIHAALSAIPWDAFPFAAGGGGFFPSPVRPRVLWVGAATGGRATCDLAGRIEAALTAIGIALDARPFSVHLTLARIKSNEHRGRPGHADRPAEGAGVHARQGDDWGPVLREIAKIRWPEIVMDRFVLWRSILGGGDAGVRPGPPGPRYVPLGTYAASG